MSDNKKIIYHWVVPEDYQNITGFDDIPEQYRIVKDSQASSGIVIEAKYNRKWTVNPWSTRVLVKHLLEIIQTFRDKRDCDGLNGRRWEAQQHWEAEEKIEKIMEELEGLEL